ncbi:MAG: 4Fe-4S binding protein, partial [Elusimicrobiaceae bacterium]|nr:4Fe-4S binding protein [Elusimicrobiaceae bacterium]
MEQMIPVVDKNKCSGCQACVNICTHGCISMEADGEGFLYPHI